MNIKRFFLVLSLLLISFSSYAQTDSFQNNKSRKKIFTYGSLGFIGVTHIGLNQLWYKDYPRSKFHFINDNKEWLQMDKLGHAYSSYYLGIVGIKAARWAGYTGKKAIWLGGLYGTFFQTPIEIQDGFSQQWGASLGDVAANTFGTALAISQELKWGEQRIQLKYSYSPSSYASTRPNILGNGITEEFLKDYNGQTYWLSANISSFGHHEKTPKWLNIAFGYGADGMIGGDDNIWDDKDGNHFDFSHIERNRQYYLAPDIDYTKIKTKKKGLKALFIVLNAIKTPAPTLEMNKNGLKFHWLKF